MLSDLKILYALLIRVKQRVAEDWDAAWEVNGFANFLTGNSSKHRRIDPWKARFHLAVS